jgi:2-oxoglutarate ferredoxin oxidoreductase subunit gamma
MARAEVIMAGVGGKGILTTGQLLARAGLAQYKYATWLPSYGYAMRGGACECTVILSDEEIASPMIPLADAVIVMGASYFKAFEGRVRPGGVMVFDTAGLEEGVEREDIMPIVVPATQMGVSMGDARVANMILMGAYVAATKVLPPQLVEDEIEKRMGEMAWLNKEAFRRGIRLVAEAK